MPSTVDQMKAVGLPAQKRVYYRWSKIPWKTNCEKHNEDQGRYPENLFVCEFLSPETGSDYCLETLLQMKERAQLPEIKQKYQNTIDFIRGYSKKRIDDNSG